MADFNIDQSIGTQTPSTQEIIQEYFEQYVESYLPFKESNVYRALVKSLIDYYYSQLYTETPAVFKTLFEDHAIPSKIYDQLLTAIGMPEKVVEKLNTASKIILLGSFSDFQRYKASVKFIQSLGSAFSDRVSIYELFTDWDPTKITQPEVSDLRVEKTITGGEYFLISSPTTNYYFWFTLESSGDDPGISGRTGILINVLTSDTAENIADKIRLALETTHDFSTNVPGTPNILITNTNSGDCLHVDSATTGWFARTVVDGTPTGGWILKPKVIFKHPSMKLNENNLNYTDVYNQVPSLLVSENQLSQLKSNDQLILPIKSNLLLMDYNLATDVSILYSIIVSTLLKELKSNFINVYFDDASFSISFETGFFLWYYILTKRYGDDYAAKWTKIPFSYLLKYHQDDGNTYTLDSLDSLVQEYENIDTRKKLFDFFNNRVDNVFGTFYANPQETTVSKMETELSGLNSELQEYISKTINESDDVNKTLQTILDRVYDSFLLFFNNYDETSTKGQLIKKYSPYFLNYLPQLVVKIKETTSYILLYNLKPFHIELLTDASSGIISDDKYNGLFLDATSKKFLYKLIEASFFEASDIYYFNLLTKKESAYCTEDEHKFFFDIKRELYLQFEDWWKFTFGTSGTSVINLSDYPRFNFIPPTGDSLSLVSIVKALNEMTVTTSTLRTNYGDNQVGGFVPGEYTSPPQDNSVLQGSISDNYRYKYYFDKESNCDQQDEFKKELLTSSSSENIIQDSFDVIVTTP